jgi:hypothetical protein
VLVLVVFQYMCMVNCTELICLVIAMSRNIILLFCSSSNDKDNFGLVLQVCSFVHVFL